MLESFQFCESSHVHKWISGLTWVRHCGEKQPKRHTGRVACCNRPGLLVTRKYQIFPNIKDGQCLLYLAEEIIELRGSSAVKNNSAVSTFLSSDRGHHNSAAV